MTRLKLQQGSNNVTAKHFKLFCVGGESAQTELTVSYMNLYNPDRK